MLKQLILIAFMLEPLYTLAQQGQFYRMESAGLSAKTVDGGINERTYHVLRFDADSVALCSYTLTTEQKKEQYQGSLVYNDWQYFKWHKKENRVLIAGLPPAYAAWSALQIQANTLTGINNKMVVFEKIKQPAITAAASGKTYAAPIGHRSYLVFTFESDSAELFYAKNITPKDAPLLARDETRAFGKYKWMAFGTHILIPAYGQCLLANEETGQLQLLYNGKYVLLKQEALYEPPSPRITVE